MIYAWSSEGKTRTSSYKNFERLQSYPKTNFLFSIKYRCSSMIIFYDLIIAKYCYIFLNILLILEYRNIARLRNFVQYLLYRWSKSCSNKYTLAYLIFVANNLLSIKDEIDVYERNVNHQFVIVYHFVFSAPFFLMIRVESLFRLHFL